MQLNSLCQDIKNMMLSNKSNEDINEYVLTQLPSAGAVKSSLPSAGAVKSSEVTTEKEHPNQTQRN